MIRLLRATVLASAMVVFVADFVLSSDAYADHSVCVTDPVSHVVTCEAVHDPPPRDGSGDGKKSGFGECRDNGEAIPCEIPGDGTWNAANSCYASPMEPPPPLGSPLWQGHTTGTVYRCTGGQGAGFFWTPAAPPGPPPAAVLAQRAETLLKLPTWTVGSNGGPSHTTYVGLPTWLWITGRWGALTSPPAAVAGESVTATATPVSVVWSMGDGHTVTCDGPGAPFDATDPDHPPCGYTYRVDSSGQPQTGTSANDRYFTVRGSVTWRISWACTGVCDQGGGRLPALRMRTAPLPLRVFQVETVVVPDTAD